METRTIVVDGQEVVQEKQPYEIGLELTSHIVPSLLLVLLQQMEKFRVDNDATFEGYRCETDAEGYPMLFIVSHKWVTKQ